MRPELEEFKRRIEELRAKEPLRSHMRGSEVALGSLTLEDIADLVREDAGQYLLMAAAGLNRTSLKRAMREPEAQVVSTRSRRAFAIRQHLPIRAEFGEVASNAVALRQADISRKSRGGIEQVFRDRLQEEGVPLSMSPPVRQVPGLLIGRRKPDGVYPDPSTGLPPMLYVEVKNVRRVSDDIQKRLYEIAEASLEMKLIYSDMELKGLEVSRVEDIGADPDLRIRIRRQIQGFHPIVVALLICPRDEAERYRAGAEAFIDRVFFQEEVEECIAFLRDSIDQHEGQTE